MTRHKGRRHFEIDAIKFAVHYVGQRNTQDVKNPLSQLQARIGFARLDVADRRDIDAELAGKIQPIWLKYFARPADALATGRALLW